jgi:hypothetical protein
MQSVGVHHQNGSMPGKIVKNVKTELFHDQYSKYVIFQDQVSHKVIEKRRRDRINICLSELSQTVPTAFSKHASTNQGVSQAPEGGRGNTG